MNDTLPWAFWSVSMALVMGWLARSRTAPSALREEALIPPKSQLIISAVCTAFFGALVAVTDRERP